ncbi:MAG TPA: hypothetical protein VFQ61_21620 [Polyangiaceae bacterium]|nr:hypothetical protein [Polyangiaceae bacterium]
MTSVGVLFVVLGAGLGLWFSVKWRSPVYLALFVFHLMASLFFWNYSLHHPADAVEYYRYVNYYSEIAIGTTLVAWLTATIRDALVASYLDVFMAFHLFGYLALVILFRLCAAVMSDFQEPDAVDGQQSLGRRALLYSMTFLPGLHFWTSPICKDGLALLGITSFTWGMVRPERRLLALVFGLFAVGMVRPHIAALLAAAGALALVFSRDSSAGLRLLLSVSLLAGIAVSLPFLQSYTGLDELTAQGVGAYVDQRQESNLVGGSVVDISQYSFPMQVFTYLYRPMFLDASGALGLIVSFENLYLFALSLCLPFQLRRLWRSFEHQAFLRFNVIYFCAVTAILASTTANMGLALRQKMMGLPSLLVMVLMSLSAREPVEELLADEAVSD